ncbi:hypothetical protein C0995_009972 [Termitomyces sp. Mi166|nr:hypothetical protein C0995_009972 [Termitomyces sp. Mi166\
MELGSVKAPTYKDPSSYTTRLRHLPILLAPPSYRNCNVSYSFILDTLVTKRSNVRLLSSSTRNNDTEVLTAQFCDPRLRHRFNLIGVDMRGYGLTKGHIVQEEYCPADSADDIYRFLKALDLPPVHIFGLAMGCCVGLELATTHPEFVRSLTLCSPLPATELENIAAGRLEVFNLWVEAFDHDGRGPPGGDRATLEDLTLGIQQLCFNNQRTSLSDALSKNSLYTAAKNRAGSPQAVKETYHATVGWFLKRRPQSREAFARIQCSVRLIHCEDDVAYPVQHAEELQDRLRDAGITDVELYEVPGPHYGSVVNPQAVNPILLEHVLYASEGAGGSLTNGHHNHQAPTECRKMTTPFTRRLAGYGYNPNEDEDDFVECCV